MTITMVERSPRGRRLPARALLPVLLSIAFAPCSRAETTFTPSFTVQETWTDNVNLSNSDRGHSELVTELTPGFVVLERNRRLQFRAGYQIHQYLYTDKNVPNLHDRSDQLQADLKANMVEELLFLDANATRGQTAVSAFGPQLADNPYTTTNRTTVSTWRVSPYLTHRFGSTATLLARYSRDSVRTGREGYGNTTGDAFNVSLSSPGEHRFGWTLRHDRQLLSDRLSGDSSTSTSQAGLTWRVLQPLTLNANGGYDDFDYQGLGGRTRGKSWNVGYQYTPSPRTSLTMSYGHRYFGKSRALSAMHRSRHTVWNISYDDSVTTTRSQFLLPATVDTAALLDSLFMPNFPDPELRRQAVEAYLRATGLPPTLANNVNYLSNRYILQHQFQASAAFSGAHSLLMLSLYDARRNALSVQQSDSELLGSSLLNLNDNTRQRGVAANLSYRLSSHADAFAMLNLGRSNSLSTGVTQNNRGLRIGLHRQFQRRLLGTVELRRLQGSTEGSNQSYTENAISATLSMTL